MFICSYYTLFVYVYTNIVLLGGATSQDGRKRKVTELAEDILDLKAFLNTECGLTKAASDRYAEALAVDHDLGTVKLMKCEGERELAIILKSMGLSAKETGLILKVTHPSVPTDQQGI
jgi:hypothetical protein